VIPQKKNSLADRVFRTLLRIFPPEFRGAYGGEMEKIFRQQRRETGGGFFGLMRLWGETIVGIFRTAPAEHAEMFRQDGGFALRIMKQNKGFTALVICILALGIGPNTAIFSVVNSVLLRPLPYADGGRIVTLTQLAPYAGFRNLLFSVHEIEDYREQNHTLSEVVEYHSMSFDLLGEGEPRRVTTGVVSANFFDVLGVKPMMGRSFAPTDETADAPAVLLFSYDYWKENFGGDAKIVGRKFRMNDRVHTVIGVLPPYPQYPDHNDVYMPTSACPYRSAPKFIADRTQRMMRAFARLRPGVTLAQAQQDLSAVAARFQATYPDVYPQNLDFGIRTAFLGDDLTRNARPTLWILLAAAGLILLLVCANVANLSLSRQLRRDRELGIRLAMGASRSRILRQMVTESTILSLAGGALGLLLAKGGLRLLVSYAARFTPRANEITVDSRVLLFSLGLSLLTGIIFGSIPAMLTTGNVSAHIKDRVISEAKGMRSRQRARNALVIAQVALSFALMAGAGLLIRSFWLLTRVDPGFRTENVISMLLDLNVSKYKDHRDLIRDFDRQLLNKVNANPLVVSSALTLTFPLDDRGSDAQRFQIEGRKKQPNEPDPVLDGRSVTPGYFRTLQIPLERGRLFTDADGKDAPEVAILNHAMAARYWGDEDPIGHRISSDGGHWATIVGVVGDVHQYGLDKAPTEEVYQPQAQFTTRIISLLVRTRDDPMRIERELVEDVYAIDPDQPVSDIHTLEQLREQSLAPPRLTTTLLGLFALLALVITAAGIAGVMGLMVSQRKKEIGIRMALGASSGAVLRLFLGRGLLLVMIGLAAGLAGALVGTQLLSGLLFGIEPNDPVTLAGVALLLLAVAALACFGPARKATTVDPLQALRAE
jgi:putative ABC transport system permease protein